MRLSLAESLYGYSYSHTSILNIGFVDSNLVCKVLIRSLNDSSERIASRKYVLWVEVLQSHLKYEESAMVIAY